MSTMRPGRARNAADAAPVTGSVALVPLARGRQLIAPAPAWPGWTKLQLLAFGPWYAGLGMVWVADVLAPRTGWAGFVVYLLGGMGIFAGALPIAVHTLWRPSHRKFRQALAAGVAFVLTVVTSDLRTELAVEAFASSRVALLAPVADEVLRTGRISVLAMAGEWVEVNGYSGNPRYGLHAERSAAPGSLDDVLRMEGVGRAEFDRLTATMRRAGVDRVLARPGHVSFRFGPNGATYLVYARPGQPLASTGSYLERTTVRRTPLGGGWYLLRR